MTEMMGDSWIIIASLINKRNFSAAMEHLPKHEPVATLVRGTACVSIKTPQQKFQGKDKTMTIGYKTIQHL